jgi:glycerol-3-phosphate dehydrogenase (NAD(P)+)
MKQLSVIGCGRWGTFLGWYAAHYCVDNVTLYDLPASPNFIELRDTGKNAYLTLSDNMSLTNDLSEVLKNQYIIISIGCQHLRSLAKQLNEFDLDGKYFLLAMKGLEEPSGKILIDVFLEEIRQNVHVACLGGPGHVQDYMQKVPSCAVIDSYEAEAKQSWINVMQSDLIRFYYGSDVIGNQIGAALKNVIGIAAGILDGLEWHGLKGALMARAPIEVGRLIGHFGGNPFSAYGLAHLGDYEATLFSKHSHNRMYGEMFAKGERFGKLAEGVATLKAVKIIADREHIDMPICQALYQVIYEDTDIKNTIKKLFDRTLKQEFDFHCLQQKF